MTTRPGAGRKIACLNIVITLVAAGLLLLADVGESSLTGIVLLAIMVAVTELRPVHVSHGGERQSFTLTEGPLVLALALAPGHALVLGVVIGVLYAQLRRRLPLYKVLFNGAQFAAATSLAVLCAQLVTGDLGVIIGLAAFVLANEALVRLVLRVATGRVTEEALPGPSWPWLIHVLAITSTALISSHTYIAQPQLLPAFVAPAILILWSQEQSTRRRAHLTVTNALAQQARALYAGRGQDTAALVASTVRHVLTASKVEILTLDGLRVAQTVEVAGKVLHSHVDHTVFSEGWPARVLAQPTGVSAGHWAGIELGKGDRTAVLAVWRDRHQEPFKQADLMLLATLADGIADWLLAPQLAPIGDLVRPAAVDLRAHGAEAAGALDAMRRLRQRLELEQAFAGRSPLADELLAAEEKLNAFLACLVARPTSPVEDLVPTGAWRSA